MPGWLPLEPGGPSLRNKDLLVFVVFFSLVASALAEPLEMLAKIGHLALQKFYQIQKEEIGKNLETAEKEGLFKRCARLPEKLTFSLREELGNPGVKVAFFSLTYTDVANIPPPTIRDTILSILEAHEIEGRYQPRIVVEEKRDKVLYAYVVPITDGPQCLLCHGRQSPYDETLRRIYPEKSPAPEKEGDLRGVLVIYVSPEVLEKGLLKAEL